VFDLPNEEKMNGIRRFHARGNALFTEGQFRRAAIQYRAATVWYEYTFPPSEDGPNGQVALDQIRLKCLNNLAACEMSLRDWTSAEQSVTLVLKQDPTNLKALYRRAVIRRHRHDFEGASADLDRAVSIDPSSLALRREAALLRLTVRQHRQKERAFAARMLDSSKELPPAVPLEVEAAPATEEDVEDGASVTSDDQSVWTSQGDAVSGLSILDGDVAPDGSEDENVSLWDGLGGGEDDNDDRGSGFGLAEDWTKWVRPSEASGRRVDLSGVSAVSFEQLIEGSASSALDFIGLQS
jgi:tetratricopeptide (TPR) repeat protein